MKTIWVPAGQPVVYYQGRYWLPGVWVSYFGNQRRVMHLRRAPYCLFTPPKKITLVW